MSKSYKDYHIKKCDHYASTGRKFKFTTQNTINFSAFFGENCLYTFPEDNPYRTSINKIFGFSSAIHHHIQSARVGWRCLDGENIEILTYCYKDGEINNEEHHVLDTVKPNQIFECEITQGTYEYVFKYKRDDIEVTQSVSKSKDCFPIHYLIFPYFGGNEPAPHDMDIYMKNW